MEMIDKICPDLNEQDTSQCLSAWSYYYILIAFYFSLPAGAPGKKVRAALRCEQEFFFLKVFAFYTFLFLA